MNRFCITIVLIAISINNLFSQEIVKPEMVNINPDRSGDQWIVGGHRERTKAELKKLHSTPEFSPERSFRAVTLPSKINNATHKAFRSIFRQTGNCCAQASGISYNLTYELNLLRGTSANSPENLLPSHYTWAFMNWGGNYGSLYTDGWDIVIQNGCPNITDYGSIDANGDCTFWMSGYNKYKRAMKNRIKNYQTIDLTKVSGINNLKRWIFDHGRGDKTGGLANFAVYSRGATMKRLTGNTEEKGKYVITKWGKTGPHAMTIVGYNDNIRYDYNGDGKYTNNIDINADGKVDVKDWECGAFIFANSWGTGWANNGFCYMMYKVCAEPKSNGGLKEDNLVHIINVEEVPDTRLTLRMKLKHSRRENLRIKLGYSPDDKGYKSVYNKEFKMFNYYTGDNNIRGKNAKYDDDLEVELDIDDFYEKMVEGKGKFYITIENYKGKGRLTEATVTDHVRGEKYRVDYKTRTDFALLNNYSVPLNNNALILTDNYPFAVNYASSINKLRITNVELAEINNSSEASNYSNFIDKSANLTKGYSYNLSITYGHKDNPAISSQISVWIDWNQDKNLEFSEIATFGFFNKNINTLSKKITVPANAKTGKTLMRMRTSYENNNQPWGDIYNEGEVEDYTINITDAGTHTSKVDFTADKTVITEGESVRFHNNSDTGSYSWAFEGATPEISDIKNPTVAYHTPGIYRVKLTVTKDGVSNSKTVNNYITVNKKSTPDKPYVN
ncbi:MAG: GEVED domain-containing protein, partial [Bacteroidales bacterium]|nr:GEVED domain-containing protein [Bacteroidales bacterium]